MDNITQFVKPELLVLVPVLMFIGIAIKKTSFVKDKYIPAVLGFLGILLSTIYVLASTPVDCFTCVLQAIFTAFTQGVLTAGASVYLHQLKKQGSNKDE